MVVFTFGETKILDNRCEKFALRTTARVRDAAGQLFS